MLPYSGDTGTDVGLALSPMVLALSAAAVLLVYLGMPSALDRSVQHLPKPSGHLPILHNTLEVMRAQRSGRFVDWLLEICRRCEGKPWVIRVLGKYPAVVVCCPKAFEDVQKTHFDAFVKSPAVSEAMYDVLGNGIFAVSGPLWTHQRKIGSHLFSSQMVQHAMDEVVASKCMALVKRLRGVSDETQPSDRVVRMTRLLNLFTMDIFAQVGFGVENRGVEVNQNADLLDAFDRASVRILERIQQSDKVWKLMRWLNVGKEKQLAEDMKVTNDFVYGVISRSMEEKSKGDKGVTKPARKDLISLFLEKGDARYSADSGDRPAIDPQLLRDFSISFMAAGRETTSQTMSWFILMMNRYPGKLACVRKELREKLPGLSSGDLPQVPTIESIAQLVYLEAAVRETLRLFPVVAITGRSATRDVTLHDGTLIKKGMRVIMPHYAMGRMKTVWGPDAEEFKPERWIDASTGKLLVVSPFKFSAFLGGPRACLGMKFALAELKISLATLMSQFDFKTTRDSFSYTYRTSITLQIKGPLEVAVTRVAGTAG